MKDLLVRNVSEQTVKGLELLARENKRSRQAEALAALNGWIDAQSMPFTQMILEKSHAVGGIEWEQPERHAPREAPLS